jgi:4'-phosphopantetheinyl transferase
MPPSGQQIGRYYKQRELWLAETRMTCSTYAYWLEQTEADVPAADQWLSTRERLHLAGLRFDKRRRDWRIGRWTAKRALASFLNFPGSLENVEILALPSGAPEVLLFNQRTGINVSLSHRAGRGLCVVGLSGASLGCDLELVEPRDHSFITDFFTANERQLLDGVPADEQPLLATLVWSAKESALKALKVGLRLDTASLDVSFTDSASHLGQVPRPNDRAVWSPLLLRRSHGHVLRGWWRCAHDVVRTVVFNALQTGLEC